MCPGTLFRGDYHKAIGFYFSIPFPERSSGSQFFPERCSGPQTILFTFKFFQTMRNILFSILTLCVFALFTPNAQAQTAADEAALKRIWNECWAAYQELDLEKGLSFYTDNAVEIGPDGRKLSGKKELREAWEGFSKMLDEKPKFNPTNLAIRFITPDVALLDWDTESDLKLGGQQIGGKTKDMAVMHKVGGKWLIAFDSQTPVMDMSGAGN